ncbi:STAS domain-containing protein [Nonomuraea sp. NPDC049709]|uniref:STAS domain-containing protein n=1 Tax=Nonomuraea sp. NPDC049709 TaxID=3154736 RepID=UPI003440E15B
MCVLALAGELDRTNSGELASYLKQARRPGDHVVVDLAELSFMDSSGLHLLLDCHRACLADGASLHLAAAYGAPARVLEVTGVARFLPGHATLQEAIATVLRRP